jgi:DNA-binding PadR family transcriptional regulator
VEREGRINAPPLHLSANLAKPLANPWRNRIMMELHLRPMSPKQFVDEFGGPGLASIARYFRELKDWGFLEVAEELRGGQRRGAVEKIYRAIQRVYFDTPTWETLPYYLRSECSASMMEGLILRVIQAVRAGTFDAEKDRHLSWKSVQFDRRAWGEYVSRLDEILNWLTDLEAESTQRVSRTGEIPIPLTVALLAFRSPASPPSALLGNPVAELADDPTGPHFIMSPQTAKALANPWRNRILAELHLRAMSPKQFVDEFGGPDLATIARYFRQLKKWGYIEVVQELRGGTRRGSVEKVYRAIRRAHFTTKTWEELPHELRDDCSASMLDGFFLRVNEAMAAETFDAETDRHLSWKALWLDREAWDQCVTRLDEVLAWIYELEAESARRIRSAESEQIPATVALMAFRAPEVARS